MSLLLDALKRAEQEKLARQQAEPAAASPTAASGKEGPAKESSPTAAPATTASILELQPLARAGADAKAAPRSDAQAAQAVFAAKAASAAGGPRRKALWAMAGIIVLACIGGGAYFWYSLNALAPKAALRPAPLPPITRPIASTPPMPPEAPVPAPASGAPPQPAGAVAAGRAPPSAAPVAATAAVPAGDSRAGPAPAAPAESRDDQLVRLVREAGREQAPAVKLARTTEAPTIAPGVARGYDALRGGQLAEARQAYAAAVAADPGSADAALGLATVEARGGNAAAAMALYRKVLDLDPRNATALAGLAAMSDFTRPDVVETQLRTEIARHPQSAALQVALGNVYAEQARWTEAQAAYFEAYRLEPAGADILYNLAISLDRLGQQRVAADYYRRALEAARAGQPVQFDPAVVARRLAEIRP